MRASPWAEALDDVAAAGVPRDLLVPDLLLRDLVTVAGEPALLPEPFPEELVEQVDTLGELLGFAEVIRSRSVIR